MTDTPVNALGEPSPNRTDFVKWARLNLEQFARHAADENLLLRTENAKLKEDLATALDAWRKCEMQRADNVPGRFTIDNPCACGAYGGPESHAEWCGYARGVPAVQPQQEKNMELPDAIRVPLDELEADAAYIIGRVAADGSCSGVMVEAIRRRTRAVREALLAHGVTEVQRGK